MTSSLPDMCCDKCADVWFEKTYPEHTAVDCCSNTNCPCHQEKCAECQFEEGHSQGCSQYKPPVYPTPTSIERIVEEFEEHAQYGVDNDKDWLRTIFTTFEKEIREEVIGEIDLDLLRRIAGYAAPTPDVMTMNAIYIPPAQRLRNAADELEQRERDVAAFRTLIETLTKKPTVADK